MMVESTEEYVLQWDAHAKYVTERFSGLFARQALVDVTLICDEQKLRVHKLVLASCSLYFEEILQQDLGQEPVLFLDINFEILKAMVEFMYCGETTIAQQSLPSLLEAAENFKVKELVSMVEKTIRPQEDALDYRYFGNQELSEEEMCAMGCVTRIIDDDIRINSNDPEHNNNHSITEAKDINDSSSEKDICMGNDNESDQELDNTLYESMNIRDKIELTKAVSFEERGSVDDNDVSNNNNNNLIFTEETIKRESKTISSPERNSDVDIFGNNSRDCKVNDNLVSMSYKQCCDILNNECGDFADNGVGQCLRVYTHKKRESSIKVNACPKQVQSSLPESSSTICIDLLDEPISNDTPVTLSASLDTECLDDYMWHLNDESASPATTTIGETLCSDDDFDHSKNNENNSNNSDSNPSSSSKDMFEDDTAFERSSLRRSVRLSRQDGEYSAPSKRSASKRKCNKDLEHRVPEMTCNGASHSKRSYKRQSHNKSKRKDEKFSKIADAALDNANNCTLGPTKYVVTAESIDRALWGDMSDITDFEEQEDLMEYYEEDARIPFAVGLLPLRAALERMQAMPEHQPRKTRSSVAPSKQDLFCSKRKYGFYRMDLKESVHKKQNETETCEENANAVCHIQISTASQCRNRKNSIAGNVNTLQATSVTNEN